MHTRMHSQTSWCQCTVILSLPWVQRQSLKHISTCFRFIFYLYIGLLKLTYTLISTPWPFNLEVISRNLLFALSSCFRDSEQRCRRTPRLMALTASCICNMLSSKSSTERHVFCSLGNDVTSVPKHQNRDSWEHGLFAPNLDTGSAFFVGFWMLVLLLPSADN